MFVFHIPARRPEKVSKPAAIFKRRALENQGPRRPLETNPGLRLVLRQITTSALRNANVTMEFYTLSSGVSDLKVYEGTDIRNVALVGHGHSGKTSLAAGILFSAGATNRFTRVDEGNTITDFDDDEIARKITISTAVACVEWKKKKLNLLDTPGFNIFINDTKASMVAAEAAMVLVDGVAGVEVQTEKVWQFAEEFKIPRALVINKLDRERS